MEMKPAWISSQQDWPDIWGAPPETLFGVFGTTWYHKLQLPGVAEFVAKWQAAYKDGPIPVPGNGSYNGYMATRELFNAIRRAESTNNIKIIHQLESLKIPARDRMQHFDAYMNANTHQMQQTIYLARRNPKPTDATDYFEIVSWSAPKDVEDPAAPDLCRLVPYEQVPVVDFVDRVEGACPAHPGQAGGGETPPLRGRSSAALVTFSSNRYLGLVPTNRVSGMNAPTFETALGERVDDMLDACTQCGKCVEVCPSVKPAGIAAASSKEIVSGVLDIVRSGEGQEASRKWAASCMLSGECIKACDYGVNPRFLLAMARLAIAKAESELARPAPPGRGEYRDLGRDVTSSRVCSSIARFWSGSVRNRLSIDPRRGAGLRVLHRLQCAQDPAYRVACPRYHG